MATVPGLERVELHGEELTVSVADGAAALSPVAVALHGCGVTVEGITLRTPTLDDVFLELTGSHLHDGEAAA
jgi:ABC-2 type transport system ATP-binding protein